MAARKLTDQDWEVVQRLAQEWGRQVADQAFGPDGPGLDVDFATMEEVAFQACRRFNDAVLTEALARQAGLLRTPQPCPKCGRACGVARESRSIVTRGGPIEPEEPACYCPTCRRDFFPSASGAGAGRARLQ